MLVLDGPVSVTVVVRTSLVGVGPVTVTVVVMTIDVGMVDGVGEEVGLDFGQPIRLSKSFKQSVKLSPLLKLHLGGVMQTSGSDGGMSPAASTVLLVLTRHP